MSSGFVPAGTDEAPAPTNTNADWERAKQQIESRRAAKSADQGTQDGGRSLYEVLEANKAAKQDAFEEAAKLRNQFRSLDDSEIEFLDSVRESERAKENIVKSETAEQLDLFRKQRIAAEQAAIDADRKADAADQPPQESSWVTSKKRRRDKDEQAVSLAKLRKSSSNGKAEKVSTIDKADANDKPKNLSDDLKISPPAATTTTTATARPSALGLGVYDSDDDDD